MKNLDFLQDNKLWVHTCKAVKAVQELLCEVDGDYWLDLSELMRAVPRRILEGLSEELIVKQQQILNEALDMTREADKKLHALAADVHSRQIITDESPVCKQFIMTFALTDQLREMIFFTINGYDNKSNIA